MLLTVSVELPVLLIVSVAVAVSPVCTLPNARLPLNPMIRVCGTKLAVSVIGPFIVTDAELLFPEYCPLPVPVQLLKL